MKKSHKPKPLPALKRLHELLEYDFETGEITWKSTGKQAGWSDNRGYRCIRIDKVAYKVHRLIYYMFHRIDPGKKVIDHIDGNPANNRLVNLRCVKRSVNCCNTHYARKHGVIPKPEKQSLYYV